MNKALAAQDFHRISQGEQETVADLIRHFEHAFKVAYGRDSLMSQETHSALLHGQLQDVLKHIMKVPGVSGAQNYAALCMASCSEEKQLSELRKTAVLPNQQPLISSNTATDYPTQQ